MGQWHDKRINGQTDAPVAVSKNLGVGNSGANFPIHTDNVEIVFDEECLHHVDQPQITAMIYKPALKTQKMNEE